MVEIKGKTKDTTLSEKGDAWFARTGLTLACFIEMHVTRQENERLCICVLISLYDFDI
jgi:hypothetical protein